MKINAKEERPKIEQSIINKLFCFDFLPNEGPIIKEKLKQLNEFLAMLNKGETV